MSRFGTGFSGEYHGQHDRGVCPCRQQLQLITTPPVEQEIVVNVIFTVKLCHADAGLHRLRHQGDFEVAGEVGTSWSFEGDSDFTGSRGHGKNGRFSGCLSVKAFIQIFSVNS